MWYKASHLAHHKNKVSPSLPLVHLFLAGHLHLEDPGDPIETFPINKNLIFLVALEYKRYVVLTGERKCLLY